MGLNEYQAGLELAAARASLIDEFIDDHELLKSLSAFESSFDRNEEALVAIWRILQTRSAHEADIALADIRSELDHLILSAAERFADNVERHREFIGVPV